MRSVINHILNPDIQLRERLFQLLSVIALAEYLIVTIYSIIMGNSHIQIGIMIAGTILFAAIVAYTFRTGRIRMGSVIAGLLYFLIYPLTFFSSGGMYGGAPVVFAFALVYVFLITEKWERVMALAICIAGSSICYVIAYTHPEKLTRHTVIEEHAESFLSILLVTLLLCALFTFVTEVYKAENRIVQRQKKEIEELSQAQKHFFSSMSHEIRTPVNAVIGLNEMNLREDIPDEVRENSQNIEVAGKMLLHSINEIMDMSKIETGMMQIVCRNYETAAMFSDIVGMIWQRANEKGLEFVIKTDPDLPSELYGDDVRIRQILLNVLTNAVKYTKEGRVTLDVSGRPGDSGEILMIYDVSDTGIGIREEDIPYLFTAFQRVDAESTHRIEGTGLGLFIVKQLLDMMGGSVSVTSEYGKGSSFHIEIPQRIADASPIGRVDIINKEKKNRPADESLFTADGMKVLAVDDTPMNLMVVKKLLRDTGIVVETAESGAEALEKTAAEHYSVILMDHQMPEMDGIECMHRIREQKDGKCCDSRIVCLTANASEEMKELCLSEGFEGYLVKPIRRDTLINELEKLC